MQYCDAYTRDLDRGEASKTNKYKTPRRECTNTYMTEWGFCLFVKIARFVRGIKPRRSKQDE